MMMPMDMGTMQSGMAGMNPTAQLGNPGGIAQQFQAFLSSLSPQDQQALVPLMLEFVESTLAGGAPDEAEAPGEAPAGTDNENGESVTTPVNDAAEQPVATPQTANSNQLRIGNKTYG